MARLNYSLRPICTRRLLWIQSWTASLWQYLTATYANNVQRDDPRILTIHGSINPSFVELFQCVILIVNIQINNRQSFPFETVKTPEFDTRFQLISPSSFFLVMMDIHCLFAQTKVLMRSMECRSRSLGSFALPHSKKSCVLIFVFSCDKKVLWWVVTDLSQVLLAKVPHESFWEHWMESNHTRGPRYECKKYTQHKQKMNEAMNHIRWIESVELFLTMGVK